MPYKGIEEIEAALAERYSGPTERRKGFTDKISGEVTYFTYVPWEESVKQLNAIFGVFGWSVTPPIATFGDGFWTVSFGLTVRAQTEDGVVIEKTVPCVDSAEGGDSHAAKKAMSGALVKGSQLLGDAFGFYIGIEAKAQKRSGRTGTATSQESNVSQFTGAKGPSPKQTQILVKNFGYTEETLATTPFPVWKAQLDSYFDNLKKQPAF